jgi:hypothetical protein
MGVSTAEMQVARVSEVSDDALISDVRFPRDSAEAMLM